MAKKAPQRASRARPQKAKRNDRKNLPAPATAGAATTETGEQARNIRIRMYRHGLGDCFLVSLPKRDGTPFYIMIDCGIIVGSPNPNIMRDVVQSIAEVTNGFVDVLAVTHEHYDHVSGFAIAKDLFVPKRTKGKLAAGAVWFAWTEDPNDALATRLRRERQKRTQKLASFVAANQGARSSMRGLVESVDQVLGFFGLEKGKATQGTGAAMKIADSLAPVRYCRSSDAPTEFSDVPKVRVYVLGPPHDEKLLRKTDSKTEVYHMANLGAAHSFFMTFPDKDETRLIERYQPFEPPARYALQLKKTSRNQFGHDQKFFSGHYFRHDQSWRRIDNDYMGAAAEFALQLDSATNNTSLVLAIELVDSGKVLLFAADAQVGNWLSWQDVQWKFDAHTTVTGPDLLRRTVFYKVGHHGSHNATLRAKGLELMQSSELVAFVPVNHEMAVKKGWGKMPLKKLISELAERTHGRVVRADEDYEPTTSQGREFQKALAKGPKGNEKLFYEWSMTLS